MEVSREYFMLATELEKMRKWRWVTNKKMDSRKKEERSLEMRSNGG
jgi:hypothetical protein